MDNSNRMDFLEIVCYGRLDSYFPEEVPLVICGNNVEYILQYNKRETFPY